jgi:hypothetical protein
VNVRKTKELNTIGKRFCTACFAATYGVDDLIDEARDLSVGDADADADAYTELASVFRELANAFLAYADADTVAEGEGGFNEGVPVAFAEDESISL